MTDKLSDPKLQNEKLGILKRTITGAVNDAPGAESWIVRFSAVDVRDILEGLSEVAALEQRVEGLPAVKISDGDVWLIFPDAMISIESICNSRAPGPIVKKNLRAWRDKALATEEE